MAATDVRSFLEAIFKSTGDGYLAVVKVPVRGSRPAWDSNRTLYFPVVDGVPDIPDYGVFTPDCEWYFSPSLFNREDRKKEFVKEAGALWVDFDRNVDISTLTPQPSIVVRTSPERCHVYCLLNEPASIDSLESFNRKLAYAYDGDHSGWDANQLLRLPAGVNAKRDPAHVVALERIYEDTVSLDEFDYLEDVALPQIGEFHATPMPEDLSEDRGAVLDKYGDRLSRKTWDVLEKLHQDGSKRSGALWSIYSELFELGMSQEEAFALIKGTPNDKFSIRGDAALWAEVDRGYSSVRFKKSGEVRTQLNDIDHEKGLLAKEKANKQGTLIADDMELRGKLFMTESGDCYYLDYGESVNTLYVVDQKNSDFGMLMFSRYVVNPASNDAMMVIEIIKIRCRTHDYQQVHSLAYYDTVKNVCYVNRFDNNYYRVDALSVKLHRNGEDGVFFLNPPSARAWVYQEGAPVDAWDAHVFSSLNMDPTDPKPVVDRILKTWVLSVFFARIVPVKPILLFYGDPGAGKTVTLNAVAQTILGLEQWSQCMPDKVEDFYLQTSQNDFMFYDNVEALKSWMRDGLDVASTGGTVSSRQMYKKTELVTFSVSCSLALTTADPKFLKYADVLERVIPIHVVRWEENKALSKITQAIHDNRNALMGALVDDVQRCLKVIESPRYNEILEYTYADRLSDFHSFMRLYNESVGGDFDECFDFVTSSRAQDMREHNIVVRCVETWLEDPRNLDTGFSSKHLYDRWAQGSEGQAFRQRFKSARALGLHMSHKAFQLDLAKLGIVFEIEAGDMGNAYTFRRSGLDNLRKMA
jgi:DNA primase RepB-like protein